MAKRNKKATRKIERLRDRLHHADENPDFKVGWVTQYMFVMDNFDIGETKRANENRWLYTIGPQRRTRYPFETLVIPGTHYTLHWFMQCKITDPSRVPEFRYVPISTGATNLPFGTAPYVPTVQISQTKSDWIIVPQDDFINDAQSILQCLARCINQHNFTIFDARDLMRSLGIRHPLITHEETICELEFLERNRKGVVINYQNRYKRKSEVKLEGPVEKKPRFDISTPTSDVGFLTCSILDTLSSSTPFTIEQLAERFQVKEKIVRQVVDVLVVVGQLSNNNGLISSPTNPCIMSPKSPSSSCDDSYGPIPETPPQSMPMWNNTPTPTAGNGGGCGTNNIKLDSSDATPNRPYATRSATKAKHESPVSSPNSNNDFISSPSMTKTTLPSLSAQTKSRFSDVRCSGGFGQSASLPMPIPQNSNFMHQLSSIKPYTRSSPPPTQPAPKPASLDSSSWAPSSIELPSISFNLSHSPMSHSPMLQHMLSHQDYDQKTKSNVCDMNFDSPLDLNSDVDFFQSSFWDQY
jgi:hypothetical protein